MKPLFALIILTVAACRPEPVRPMESTDPAIYWQSVVVRAAAQNIAACDRADLDAVIMLPYWESLIPAGADRETRRRITRDICRMNLR